MSFPTEIKICGHDNVYRTEFKISSETSFSDICKRIHCEINLETPERMFSQAKFLIRGSNKYTACDTAVAIKDLEEAQDHLNEDNFGSLYIDIFIMWRLPLTGADVVAEVMSS